MHRFAILGLVAACGQADVKVIASDPKSDYGHSVLLAAIDKFVAAGKTPAAYGELARTVTSLRPGMDKAVAEDAELRMLVLALSPVQSVQEQPIEARVSALALTVWPSLLAPKIEADALLQVRDPKAPELVVHSDEDPASYLVRLCGKPLNADCKRVVPEMQGPVVEAVAYRNATERVRNAITVCLPCSGERADPGWRQAIAAWEALDRTAAEHVVAVARRGDPDNWPQAGAAADDDPGLPEAEVTARGDIVVGGHAYGPNEQRIAVIRDLRGTGDAIALHVLPGTRLQEVRALLVDARRAGCARVAVIAREGVYPWRRKAYWVADGSGMRASLRPTDSLQLLLHAIDEVAGPGTVARVD
jgi:hypothetical protein